MLTDRNILLFWLAVIVYGTESIIRHGENVLFSLLIGGFFFATWLKGWMNRPTEND